MSKPKLIIIAGPNGAGKSTLSSDIVANYNLTPFDFDKEYYQIWAKYSYDPAVQRGCKEFVSEKFEELIKTAFNNSKSFCFETNYHTTDIIQYLDLADKFDFEKYIYFIGLKSVELCKERVQFRVDHKGHYVPNEEIEFRYRKGFEILDNSFNRYDKVIISESLPDFKIMHCVGINNDEGYLAEEPSFIKNLPVLEKVVKGMKRVKNIGFSL